MNSDHKNTSKKNISRTNKSKHKDTMISKLQQIAQGIGPNIKKCEEHEQIQMENAGERKNRKVG